MSLGRVVLDFDLGHLGSGSSSGGLGASPGVHCATGVVVVGVEDLDGPRQRGSGSGSMGRERQSASRPLAAGGPCRGPRRGVRPHAAALWRRGGSLELLAPGRHQPLRGVDQELPVTWRPANGLDQRGGYAGVRVHVAKGCDQVLEQPQHHPLGDGAVATFQGRPCLPHAAVHPPRRELLHLLQLGHRPRVGQALFQSLGVRLRECSVHFGLHCHIREGHLGRIPNRL
mmetsp:Transcript_82882/g.238180  ORF Transcript_82882/g.238180 Transcript_82882/m.238180 type:complete len:228 (-) Transcript_82882:427-1110(-)